MTLLHGRCMGWSKRVLLCGRHMGCKFDDSCVLICGINFKAGYFYMRKMNRVFVLLHFTWSGFDAYNVAAWAMHGGVAGPSGFYRVAYIWDTRLMTVVYSRKSSQCS